MPWPANSHRQRAMTLIEVVAGLAILGTVLASLIVARGRYLHQWALAARREEAIAVADQLLSAWSGQTMAIAPRADGELREKKMRWEIHVINPTPIEGLNVVTVRLDIFDENQTLSGPALATVDLLTDGPKKTEPQN